MMLCLIIGRVHGSKNKGVGTRVGSFNVTPSDPLGNSVFPILTTLVSVGLEVQVPKGSKKGSTECHLCTFDSLSREQQVRRVTTILAGVSDHERWEELRLLVPNGVGREERRRAGDPLGASGDSPSQL